MAAICLTSLLTLAFIFIGQVNVLAPIVSINFILTYSFIDYSYFIVAMTFQLQTKEKACPTVVAKISNCSSRRQSSRPLIEVTLPKYGTEGENLQVKGTLLEFTKDMEQIFPPMSTDAVVEKTSMQQLNICKGRKANVTTKQKLMNSFGLDLNSNMFPEEEQDEVSSEMCPPHEEAGVQYGVGESRAEEEPQVKDCSKIHHTEQDSSAETHHHCKGVQL